MPPTPPNEPTDLDPNRLWDQYKNALDEYRFQVNINSNRSQYFFVLNIAILAAGVGLLSAESVPLALDMVVFAAGAAIGAVSIFATDVQHSYYRNARDLKRQLEDELGLEEHAIATTKAQGGKRKRIAKVQSIQKFMLAVLIVANLTGLGVSIARAVRPSKAPKVELAVRVFGKNATTSAPIVVRRSGRIAASTTAQPGTVATVEVRPGTYSVSVLVGAKICTIQETITASPLQTVVVPCGSPVPARTRSGSRKRKRTGR